MNHRYSCLKGQTLAGHQENSFRPIFPPPRYQLSQIGLKPGEHFIRFIRRPKANVLESISPFLNLSFMLMSGRKSSRACIRFSSTAAMNWSLPFLTDSRPGWTQTLETTVPKKARKVYFS
jgi:hypothetical protein